jgi:general L-amino acid transport system ATP-binding protein
MPPDEIEPIIRVEGISKSFGDFLALKNVSLDVAPGERVVICGPSGSGKSTLIRCINGLEQHQSGSIAVKGVELDHSPASLKSIKVQIGMVFQQFNLFPHLTVLENLTLGPIRARKMSKSDAHDLAMRYLERVHIPEQADKYPPKLSGGQQQRVAIARSLCMEPSIMLFDEPTSALDPEMINEVLDVMAELATSGMTMICVTHETGFARRVADKMVFMDHGEIVEMAEPEKFFTAPDSQRCRDFLAKILHH